jgi:hypothetical protein
MCMTSPKTSIETSIETGLSNHVSITDSSFPKREQELMKVLFYNVGVKRILFSVRGMWNKRTRSWELVTNHRMDTHGDSAKQGLSYLGHMRCCWSRTKLELHARTNCTLVTVRVYELARTKGNTQREFCTLITQKASSSRPEGLNSFP